MAHRIVLVCMLALAIHSPIAAQPPGLDAEASGPCLWRIVVKAEPHPLLTSSFRDQVRRDLIAALQPDLGPLGAVDVIDLEAALAGKADALVQDFAAKGFAALDTPRDLTGVKTHFLRIEVREGQYHLETRQHDGFVGLASPLVRKQSTRSPELVGRAAGLMIGRDFGITGTLEQPYAANATEVTVRFRGSKLNPKWISRFVKKGDVFALGQITRVASRPAPPPARTATGKVIAPPPGSIPPAALTSRRHSFTLLKVLDLQEDGTARCAVFRAPKYAATLPSRGAAGYRCIKLSTVQSPISVRLVSGDGAAATASSANVRATENGFKTKEDPKDYLDFRDGLYRSSRPFSNMACITVSLGKTKAEHFPVPVLNSDPITLRFELSPEAEARASFERSVIALTTRGADARIAQASAFEGIGRLIASRKNADALARARAAFDAADASDKVLSEEAGQLQPKAGTVPGAAALLAAVGRHLAELRANNTRLARTIQELEKVVEKEKDPAVLGSEVKAQSLNARINLLLAAGEIEEALAAYDQLASLQPNDANIKARRAKLAAQWKPKDAEHAKQREYLLKTWPAVATIQNLKESLPQLRASLDTCKKAGDKLGIRRFVGILGGFPTKLTDLIKDLDPNTEADRKSLKDAKIVRDIISKIEMEAIEFLKKS